MTMSKKALVLVDLQNDFFPGGALPVANAPEILPVINRLLNHPFDFIIATKDWHPINHGSFAIHHGKSPGEKIVLNGLDQTLWPVHCVKGTKGADFYPGWQADKVQKIFLKGTDPAIDSYSTFFDNGHIKSTGLHDFLKENGVDKIYICGLATDYCVKYSVLDAVGLGFKSFVITDACRGVNLKPGDSAQALEEMERAGAFLVDSQQAIALGR